MRPVVAEGLSAPAVWVQDGEPLALLMRSVNVHIHTGDTRNYVIRVSQTLDLNPENAAQDGEPLALLMRGVNLYTGGHFDEYDATFFDYKVRACLWLLSVAATCIEQCKAAMLPAI